MGHYEIECRLGAGGMGEVYRAVDSRLHRTVAVKVLPQALTADRLANERFMREARAASACDHPNICTIYEVDESDVAGLYLAMACYEGETLKERIVRGPLPIADALSIIAQVCSGLERAHEAGLVHRDIKPGNIILTERGEVKILDFGLAKLVDETHLTNAGTAVGTAAYMSPEQIAGDAVDHRTDIWAAGVVLYEMIAGRRPFEGGTASAVFDAIRHSDAAPLSSPFGPLPVGVKSTVMRALARNPADRYDSAGGMLRDVRAALSDAPAHTDRPITLPPPPAPRGGASQAPSAGGSSSTITRPSTGSKPAHRDVPSIAVLPFEDLSQNHDHGWLCDGISEEIITALAKVRGLRVVARSSAFQFKGKTVDAREIGRTLHVAHLLTGGVRTAGTRLRVTVQLVDANEGFQLWSDRYDETLEDVFGIQDRIARAAADQLKVQLAIDESLIRRPTADIEAYQLYLKGRHFMYQWTVEGVRQGVECFKQALAIDPTFAQPYVGIADVYVRQSIAGVVPPHQVMPRAKEAALRAIELDDSLPDAHAALGWVQYCYEWDWEGARRTLEHARQLGPGNETIRGRYSMFLGEQGRFEEGIAEARRAVDLAPISADARIYLVHGLFVARQYAACADMARQTLELRPGYVPAAWYLAMALVADRAYDEALEVLYAVRAAQHPFTEGSIGWILGQAGRHDEARAILHSLEERRAKAYFSAPALAYVHIGLGELDRALDWLETAYEDRDPHCLGFNFFPQLDPLRGHPRFEALARRMNNPGGTLH